MLRASLNPCLVPICRRTVIATATKAGVVRRAFMSSPYRLNSLTSDAAQTGATTPHKKQQVSTSTTETVAPKEETSITTPTAVSTVPTMIRGDWVLFHPVYTPEELKAVEVLHLEAKTFSDKIAYALVKLARAGFDIVSRYKHKTIPPCSNMTLEQLRKEGYLLDDKAWLNRILFLESIAGVPGMVAATLRHLQSLRLMRRDNGWVSAAVVIHLLGARS
ncbi:hypothetical protein HGRIS_005684 [Hohenbuehelia grisea]|uniref:Alternative oxidase n=1 Tax=Hohenbuehelia grisea TaxID=104357 RepID=A0ABR3JZW2_9AGAR